MRNYLKLYVVTTNDEYELPVLVGTMAECEAYLGKPQRILRDQMCMHEAGRQFWNEGYKIFRCHLEERIGYEYSNEIREG